MRSLLYLYDPLCGWCYAATPSITRLRMAGIAVWLQPTGLFSDPGRQMTADFAEYAWQNDQRIAEMTGQTFTPAYRRQVLQATGTAFDSTAATLGLTALAMDEPAREADGLRALQEARYMSGRDITNLETVGAILAEAGFAKAAAALKSPATTLMSTNAARVAAGAAAVRDLGAKGVPTLVLVDGSTQRLLSTQLLYGPPAALLAMFDAATAS